MPAHCASFPPLLVLFNGAFRYYPFSFDCFSHRQVIAITHIAPPAMNDPFSSHIGDYYDLQGDLQSSSSTFYLGLQNQDWTVPVTPFGYSNLDVSRNTFIEPVVAASLPRRTPIETIPNDIFLFLSRYLMLKDLVILGSTSRTMWGQCYRQQHIWTRQLALICRPQALAPALLLEPGQPPNECRMSYVQLAHFCQWPSRFLHAIQRPSKDLKFIKTSFQIIGSTSEPQAGKRNKRKKVDPAPQPTQGTLNLQLLPGGRHLVVADSKTVKVYDLGLRHTQGRSVLLASVNLNLDREFKPQCRPVIEVYNYATAGCDRFRILVIHDNAIDRWSISAFEVGLKESEPNITQRLLTAHVYGPRLGGRLLYAVRDDFLVTLSGSTLKIWHILGQESAICWDIGDIHKEAKLLTIAVPFTVLIIHPDGVLGWRIPEGRLQSLEYGPGAPYVPGTPDIIYPLEFTRHILDTWKRSRSATDSVTIGSSNWDSLLPMWHDYDSPLFEGRAVPQVMFEVKTRLKVNRTERLFRWRYSYFLPGPGNTNGALMSTYHYEVPNQWDQGFRYIGMNENYHLLAGYSTSHQTGGIVGTPLTVYNPPGQAPSEEQRATEIKRPHKSMFWSLLFKKKVSGEQIARTMTMCPLTGRICHERAPYEIGVIDYFCVPQMSDS